MKTTMISLSLVISFGALHSYASTCGDAKSAKTVADCVRLGDCLRGNGDSPAAISAYRLGLVKSPAGSRDLYLGLALAYLDQGRWQSQMEAIQAAHRLDPADPETLYWLGITYELAQDWEPALENFRKAIAARPNDNRAHRNIGFVLLRMGEPNAAIGPLETAIAIAPNDWKAHLNLASAYTKAPEALRNELHQISSRGGHVVSPHEQEMMDKLKTVDYAGKSLEHARRAAELRPDDAITWHGLGNSLIRHAKYREAIDALRHADSIEPGRYEIVYDLAYAQKMNRQPQEALESCRRIEGRGRRDKQLQVLMGDVNATQRDDEAAETHYRAAIALDPQDWEVRVALARALRRMNRAPEAEKEIAAAKEMNPKLVQVIEGFYANK